MWWKLGPEPRSDLTFKPVLWTLLHTAPGLIIHPGTCKILPQIAVGHAWGYSHYPELSLVNQKRRVLQRSGLQFHSTQQGKGGGGMFFTLVIKLQENFSPSGPAISSSTASISAKQQVEKTRESSDHKPCKDRGPLISACNENFSARKKLGSGVRRPKVHTHLVGFVIPTLTGTEDISCRVSSPRRTKVPRCWLLLRLLVHSGFHPQVALNLEPENKGRLPQGLELRWAGGHRLHLCIGQT